MNTLSRMLIGLSAISLVSCSSGGMHHDASSAPLAQEVRRATDRYQDVSAATAAGYSLFLGCVSSPAGGAMGIHYVNAELVGDGKIDAARPEALIYEPKGGKLELVMGQLFHLNSSPNRYGIPAFYALHVWAWRHNPQGTFVDYNPRVSCDGYPTEAAR